MKKFLKIALLCLLALILYVGYGIVKRVGMMQSVDPMLYDKCHKVKVAPGCEDIQYDSETGLVFITADNRHVTPHTYPLDEKARKELLGNGVYALDISPENVKDIGSARKVSPADLEGFRPHGLYFWNGGNGDKRLFVVNHRVSDKKIDEVIEVFQIGEEGMLTLLESISFPEMTNPNDVVAIGPRQFYATNFLKNHAIGGPLYKEIFLAEPLGSIVYYDGQKGEVVAKDLAAANGINISPDHKTIYACEWTNRTLAIFDRKPDNSLTENSKIYIPASVDNVHVDDKGDLWIAGQPKLLELFNYVLGKAKTISSLAVKVDGKTKEQKTIFATKEQYNATSVSVPVGNKLLLGSVHEDHVLICPNLN